MDDEGNHSWPYPILESSSIQSLDQSTSSSHHHEQEVIRELANIEKPEPVVKKIREDEEEGNNETEVQRATRRSKKQTSWSSGKRKHEEVEAEGQKRRQCPDEVVPHQAKQKLSAFGQLTQSIDLNVRELEAHPHPHNQHQHPPSFHDFL